VCGVTGMPDYVRHSFAVGLAFARLRPLVRISLFFRTGMSSLTQGDSDLLSTKRAILPNINPNPNPNPNPYPNPNPKRTQIVFCCLEEPIPPPPPFCSATDSALIVPEIVTVSPGKLRLGLGLGLGVRVNSFRLLLLNRARDSHRVAWHITYKQWSNCV
jgi:hypothetical protein